MFLDDLFDFDPYFWDKDFYNFNRIEKDMHPYSIEKDEDKKVMTIVHNVLGLEKKDLKITRERKNDGQTYIVIKGETKDDNTGHKYSINSRFAIDDAVLDISKAKSTMKNGLLYITIPYKKENKKLEDTVINID